MRPLYVYIVQAEPNMYPARELAPALAGGQAFPLYAATRNYSPLGAKDAFTTPRLCIVLPAERYMPPYGRKPPGPPKCGHQAYAAHGCLQQSAPCYHARTLLLKRWLAWLSKAAPHDGLAESVLSSDGNLQNHTEATPRSLIRLRGVSPYGRYGAQTL